MAQFVHTIRITELKKNISYESQADVICHARWKLTTYRDDNPNVTVDFQGATPFVVTDNDLTDNFTPFDSVTEAQIISWVEANAINLFDLKLKNERELNEKLSPTVTEAPLPWDPDGTASATPPKPSVDYNNGAAINDAPTPASQML